jgi:hypothetical protein
VFDDYEYYGLTEEESAKEREKLKEIIIAEEKALERHEREQEAQKQKENNEETKVIEKVVEQKKNIIQTGVKKAGDNNFNQKRITQDSLITSNSQKKSNGEEEGVLVGVHTNMTPSIKDIDDEDDYRRRERIDDDDDIELLEADPLGELSRTEPVHVKKKNSENVVVMGLMELAGILKKRAWMRIMKVCGFFFFFFLFFFFFNIYLFAYIFIFTYLFAYVFTYLFTRL